MKRAVIQTSLILILSVAFFANTFADSCEGVCNRPPVAENTFFVQINQFESTTGTLPASDPDSDPLIFTIVKPPVGGTISDISSAGEFTYSTIGNFSGTDYILFKVNDGEFDSDVATATIQVEYINRAPTVSNINLTAPQNVPFVFDKGLLGEDLDSDPLIYTIVFTTKHGVLTFFDNTTGNFTYIPDIGFVGTDVFTYLANDGYATSSIATGTINFVLNNPPVITVLGDNPLLVPVGGKYKDPFATAEDLEDGDITSTIVVTDNVDTNTVGTYQITYTSADIFGVSTSSARIVIVYNLSDDIDKDGIINSIDPDVDGDGIINNIDDDIDGDGTENKIDNEDDGDGILDGEDTTPSGLDAYDFDYDKIVNDLDLDLDGDGIINFYDADVDGDGLQNNIDSDDDNDGVLDNSDSTPHGFGSANDFDGDGILNVDDLDLDGDGILSSEDDDIDGDGLTNDIDTDDDGDGILDILDKNPKIYLAPGDELKKETNTTSSSGGGSVVPVVAGGGGANNFNYGLGTINLATSTGVVLGASIDLNTCGNYLDPKTIIGPGLKNRKEDVMLLQKFLNGELNFKLPITGYYGKLTQNAVKKFQLKYKKEILEPWGITEPTFFVYHTTIHQINSLMCPAHTGPLDQSKLIPLK